VSLSIVYVIVLGAVAAIAVIGDVILGVTGHDQSGLLKITATVVGALAVIGGVMKISDKDQG
jgi:hypothetical protein